MPLPLLLVFAPLIKGAVGKWAVGHIATALAHAPAHAVATFAHQIGTNAVVAAANASNATAALTILYKSGKTAKKLADKVLAIQSQEELQRVLHEKHGLTPEEKVEALSLVIVIALFEELLTAKKDRRIDATQRGLHGPDKYKTKVTHLAPCTVAGCTLVSGKRCIDFARCDDACYCGHGKSSHAEATAQQLAQPDALRYIFDRVAEGLYRQYGHRAPDGEAKRYLQEINPCSACACADFDLAREKGLFASPRCYCGHKDKQHRSFAMFSQMAPSDYSWIVGTAVADIIDDSNLAVNLR